MIIEDTIKENKDYFHCCEFMCLNNFIIINFITLFISIFISFYVDEVEVNI